MTTLREAAQQALEALLTYEQYIQPLTNVFGGPRVPEEGSASAKVDAAITALRAALAEPVQEPVAWLFTNLQSGDYDFCYQEDEHDHDREMWHKQPLYTSPPQRKPLTRKEALAIVDAQEAYRKTGLPMFYRDQAYKMIRAVERAHGIGEKE